MRLDRMGSVLGMGTGWVGGALGMGVQWKLGLVLMMGWSLDAAGGEVGSGEEVGIQS